jgi:hypothetical protein
MAAEKTGVASTRVNAKGSAAGAGGSPRGVGLGGASVGSPGALAVAPACGSAGGGLVVLDQGGGLAEHPRSEMARTRHRDIRRGILPRPLPERGGLTPRDGDRW